MILYPLKRCGTDVQVTAGQDNVFAITDGSATRFLWKAGGEFHLDCTSLNAMDVHCDVGLLRTLETTLRTEGVIKSRWDDFVSTNICSLIDAGLYSVPPSEGGLLNVNQLLKLHNGAVWQLHTRIQDQSEELSTLRTATLTQQAALTGHDQFRRQVATDIDGLDGALQTQGGRLDTWESMLKVKTSKVDNKLDAVEKTQSVDGSRLSGLESASREQGFKLDGHSRKLEEQKAEFSGKLDELGTLIRNQGTHQAELVKVMTGVKDDVASVRGEVASTQSAINANISNLSTKMNNQLVSLSDQLDNLENEVQAQENETTARLGLVEEWVAKKSKGILGNMGSMLKRKKKEE